MPETKKAALARAKKLGFPKSNVTKAKTGDYYIAPKGLKHKSAKKFYADCRAKDKSQESCAKLSHYIDNKMTEKER